MTHEGRNGTDFDKPRRGAAPTRRDRGTATLIDHPLSRRSFLGLASTLGLLGVSLRSTRTLADEPTAVLPTFLDIAARSSIRFKHDASRTSQKYLIEAMGSGVG